MAQDTLTSESGLRRVVIVGDFADITGGQAKVAIDSARLLAARGIEVVFFAGCGPVNPALDLPGINVICLDQPDILNNPNRMQAAISGIWNRAALRRLQALVREFDPRDTVLHCHGYAKALSPAIGRVLARGRLQSVFTMHEYFLACPNGGFFDYGRNEICHRTALGPSCLRTNCDVRHPAHKAWRVLRGVFARGPGALPRGLRDVIYISQTQHRVMAPYLPDTARLHHLPNPVAPGGPPVEFSGNDAFVFVGRLNPEKGGLMFAQAAKAAGVRAIFVGDGGEREAILAANPEAVVTGWQTPARVQDWLGQARALVFPSLWYEGQPLVPMEALLRGIPVVCGSWSAASEVVQDMGNGVVYDAPTVAALAAALRRVADVAPFTSDDLARTVSETAHVDGLLRIYAGLLDRVPG